MSRRLGSSEAPARADAVFLIVGTAFSVIGACALAVCVVLMVAGWQSAAAQSATTTGTITVIRSVASHDHNDSTCSLRYEYQVDGRHYDAGTRTSDTWAMRPSNPALTTGP